MVVTIHHTPTTAATLESSTSKPVLENAHADECEHTGGWESQVVIPKRSTLTVEKEVTRLPSDGQGLCLTPWSNAVNTHSWLR